MRTPSTAQPTPTIRLADASDTAQLVELINAAYAIEDFLEGTRINADGLAAHLAKGTILLAEEADGRITACVYLEPRGTRGYLGLLAVDPARQGLGLARRMAAAGEDWFRARGCQVIEILILSLRPELLPLYQRFGFVETGTEEFRYPRAFKPGVECHCIAMEKRLVVQQPDS